MRPFFIRAPSGELIAFHHIVRLEVETTGVLDQLRHEVHATTVTGDKHVLGTTRGPGAREQAEHLIAELLRQGDVPDVRPSLVADARPSR
ncbi:hypothetical protein [Deinococcus sonorensis]|uniref:Uncharacterized protein n=2 Tax=Deinococcus sonorensis TaxID=309891 RepID=A0AAU7U5T8_9DEIO